MPCSKVYRVPGLWILSLVVTNITAISVTVTRTLIEYRCILITNLLCHVFFSLSRSHRNDSNLRKAAALFSGPADRHNSQLTGHNRHMHWSFHSWVVCIHVSLGKNIAICIRWVNAQLHLRPGNHYREIDGDSRRLRLHLSSPWLSWRGTSERDREEAFLGSLLILQLRKGKKLSSKCMVCWIGGRLVS